MKPGLEALRPIACGQCGARRDLMGWLDAAARVWPGERRVEARCPACQAPLLLELRGEQIRVGALVGAPRELFRPERTLAQPGLRVTGAPDGLLVELLHRRWVLAAR